MKDMVTFTFNESETKLLMDFLEDYRERLSNAGCNEFDMPNTPGNLEIFKQVSPEGFSFPKNGDSLYTLDILVLEYLMNKIKSQTPE